MIRYAWFGLLIRSIGLLLLALAAPGVAGYFTQATLELLNDDPLSNVGLK